ncbi:hypothetical protein L6218_16695 [Pseudomonas syringae pv. syringae]|uniref:hypothetical protein n=1 Tax=Pseudomonas TaxID=286 RepID=UPI0006B9B269|nr:hypothetical protein [Pseudomonas syringae]KPB27238.1 Uncharacterized protein AC518_4238 [Pseudomonas syringae pv. syringae]KWS09812.1 hypothetical protein AL063_18265 [Pseudomonas syringae pv. syringae]MCH5497170.1 hypothetical protein [Pseudomonas syringae pv. syringae]MCH5523427.1 hypothetical protein [Pseudomonas syringae pv. syringae]MCH5561082.1 hypothetical protein [Pseudomonas syringae pv. syringae]
MDWDPLLGQLWADAASDPEVLAIKIRACLDGHSSDGLLEAISLLVAQNQNEAAKRLLNEFLRNHQAADFIRRRLELSFDSQAYRTADRVPTKGKLGGNEVLLKDVNSLVASGELDAAETIIQESISQFEEPDDLVLLSRVYLLQGRASDSAKAEQRGLMLKRQRQAFVETISAESLQDDLPTMSDLAFIDGSASVLAELDGAAAPSLAKTLTMAIKSSLNFVEQTSSLDLTGRDHPSWGSTSQLTSDEFPDAVDDRGEEWAGTELTAGIPESAAAEGKEKEEEAPAPKNILKLARPRGSADSDGGLPTVKMVTRSTRSWHVVPPSEQPTEPESFSADATPNPSLQVDLPTVQNSDYVEYEYEYDDNDDEESERYGLPDSGLVFPTVPATFADDAAEDDDGVENGLQGLSIIYLETEYEPESAVSGDDFRDVDDDYAAYAFDPDEVFDELACEDTNGQSDRLSRQDRALQKAAELIGSANWPFSALPLVQQIFVMSGWGATRLALEREIEKGLTPQELILASHIKVIWAENDIYWIAFDKTGSSRLSHQVLSWPTALLIVRSFDLLPQMEELEVFLEELFASWYENNILRRAFRAFARYLWFKFSSLPGCLPANQHFDFCDPRSLPAEEYSDLGFYDLLEIEKAQILRRRGVIATKHPQEPSCYFSDKPPRVIEEPPPKKSIKQNGMDETESLEDAEDEDEIVDDDDLTTSESSNASLVPMHALTIDQPTLGIERLEKGSAHEAP